MSKHKQGMSSKAVWPERSSSHENGGQLKQQVQTLQAKEAQYLHRIQALETIRRINEATFPLQELETRLLLAMDRIDFATTVCSPETLPAALPDLSKAMQDALGTLREGLKRHGAAMVEAGLFPSTELADVLPERIGQVEERLDGIRKMEADGGARLKEISFGNTAWLKTIHERVHLKQQEIEAEQQRQAEAKKQAAIEAERQATIEAQNKKHRPRAAEDSQQKRQHARQELIDAGNRDRPQLLKNRQWQKLRDFYVARYQDNLDKKEVVKYVDGKSAAWLSSLMANVP